MSPLRSATLFVSFALLFLSATAIAQRSGPDQKIGVEVPEGFEVTLFADDDLAHDIHSMAIDSLGRVVVSGPGYVRFLLDEDGDGKADRAPQFVAGPRTGAQGMFFHGRDLICSGDEGLQIYRDDDRNDKADGEPEVFLRIKAGGEHHVHSIQHGPDGWWYVIAGNHAGVSDVHATLATSPLKRPHGGVIMRLQPDLLDSEIVCDGFRNAYDFTITRQGDFFTFDSDGERDVSLPWYRPTRVFHALPMSNSGWVSPSWKRPNYFLDMPPVLGSFGRGSPTGVLQYQHDRFPKPYRGALFVLDWTYGRVIALPLAAAGSVWKSEPTEFMSSVGSFGFAPTDAVVGPDGSLYVSVGGRGTRGGVYRVTFGDLKKRESAQYTENDDEQLKQVLDAHQPLSSWSRAQWMQPAKRLGAEPFSEAATNEKETDKRRMRAIEILTEMFGGLDKETARELARSDSAAIRARAAWALGRMNPATPDVQMLTPFLNDESPLVNRFAVEAFQSATSDANWADLLKPLARNLGSDDRFVRQSAARIVSRLPKNLIKNLVELGRNNTARTVSIGLGLANRSPELLPNVLEMSLKILESGTDGKTAHTVALQLEAARLFQMSLGDVGAAKKGSPAYEGYAPRVDLSEKEKELNPIRVRLAELFPTGDETLDREVSRSLSMLTPRNDGLLEKMLAKISDKTDPVSDIHYLLVASRIAVDRNAEQTQKIATTLAVIDKKIEQRELLQDTNWNVRMTELYATLVERDEALPVVLSQLPDFGRRAHVLFLGQLPPKHLQNAIDAFVKQIEDPDEYEWSNDIVFTLGDSKREAHLALLRDQFENMAVQSAVTMVLSRKPVQADREKFVEGLGAPDLGVLISSVNALTKLPVTKNGKESVALLKAARRLSTTRPELQVRDQVITLLRKSTGKEFGFKSGEKGFKPQPAAMNKWTEYILTEFTEEAAVLTQGSQQALTSLRERLSDIDWSAGDIDRGKRVFQKRSCAQCHDGHSALGPNLAGVTGRFSRADLFTSIVAPNKDVSPRYQTMLIETKAGKVFTGLVIHQAVDALLLRTGQNQTFRLEGHEIQSTRAINESLMPAGLLQDAKSGDYADLYAYLASLKPAPAPKSKRAKDIRVKSK